jgi:hypothetical protein
MKLSTGTVSMPPDQKVLNGFGFAVIPLSAFGMPPDVRDASDYPK